MYFFRILIALAAVLGIGTAYLPWKSETLLGVTTKTAGVDTPLLLSDMQMGDGWIAAICFGLIIILVVVGKRQIPIGMGKKGGILLLSAIILFVIGFDVVKMKKLSVSVPGSLLSTEVNAGLGLYFCGALALFVALLAFAGKAGRQQVAISEQRKEEL